MKRLMGILGFLLLANLTFSQSIVQENKMWNVIQCLNFGPCITTSYKILGDTTIDNIAYKKLYTAHDTLLNNWYLSGAMRESQDKVFVNDFMNETMLYDFGLSVSDTFRTTISDCPIELILIQIDTVTIFNGEQRQRYIFEDHEMWIRGIGSLNGLMEVGVYQCMFDLYFDLSCCHVNEVQLYKSTVYEHCLVNTVALEENTLLENFSINPNPFSEYVTIKSNQPEIQIIQIQIRNSTGQIVRTIDNVTSGEIIVSKDQLKPGLYFFQLLDSERNIATGKLIVR